MPSISDKLRQINEIKQGIKEAIIAGGGTIGDDFSKYPEAVSKFSIDYKNPDFYDIRTQNGTNFDGLFSRYNGPDIDVSQWDTSKVTSAQYCFANCIKPIDISNWDLSSLTNAQYMFDYCSSTITGLDNMNFSNITNASYMFNYFTNGNKYIDLSALDFSNVTNVNCMFQNSNTNYLDVRNINLTGTTNYNYLFNSCSGTELDLSTWDISKVNSIACLCYFSGFKKINLSGWKTVNVKDMSSTFYYMSNLETLLIPDWDMTNATSTSSFLYSVSKLKYIDLSRSNDFTINKIASFLPTKTATAYGEVAIPANTSQDAIDALIAKYWKPIGAKFDVTSIELALELDEIKPGKTTKVWTGNNDPWYGDDRLEAIEFISSDESIATINGREITGVSEGTVTIECRRRDDSVVVGSTTLTVSETDSNPNLIKFRIDENTLTNYYSAITVNGTGVTPMNLTKDPITGIYSYDPGTQITSIKFCGSSSYNYTSEIIKFNFNALNITDMYEMFNAYKGTEIDLSDFDTSNVTRIGYLFGNANNLINIKGYIDCSNVSEGLKGTNIEKPFRNCDKLETVYLKNIYKNCTMDNSYNKWSIDLGDTKVKDECLLYIINELPDLYAKGLTETSNITFTLPPTNTLTQEQVAVGIAKGWTFINVNN